MATKARVPETERYWLRVLGTLNEAQARMFVAQKALEEGRGAVRRLARLTDYCPNVKPMIMRHTAPRRGVGQSATGRLPHPRTSARSYCCSGPAASR
jgi:hypothetical protein